ncbi:MAG: hypothetical protein CM1200mP24_03370 [Gammaproteobacteria bacterium]|nr:MAG: hypothetical protein CM1200mP24_03370 [Gammaproteobacteria bacterium]
MPPANPAITLSFLSRPGFSCVTFPYGIAQGYLTVPPEDHLVIRLIETMGFHCFDNTFMVNPKEVRAKCVLSSFISYEILIVSMGRF